MYRVHLSRAVFELITLVMIGSCKPNNHTIMFKTPIYLSIKYYFTEDAIRKYKFGQSTITTLLKTTTNDLA
jgi:hypothetical protein